MASAGFAPGWSAKFSQISPELFASKSILLFSSVLLATLISASFAPGMLGLSTGVVGIITALLGAAAAFAHNIYSKGLSLSNRKAMFGAARMAAVVGVIVGAVFAVGVVFALSSITVTAPNGNEKWSGTQAITWTTTGCVPATDFVNIQYSTGGLYTTISTVACSPGTYNWDTTTVTDGTNYQIRIYLDGNLGINDVSNAVFTVDNTPPTFTAARTALNTIVLTFSENVDAAAANENSAWTVAGATVTAVTDPANTNTLTITTTGLTSTSSTPAVTYVAASGTVADAAGNEVANGATANAADQVSPTLSSASTTTITTLTATFSEDLDGSTVAASDFTVAGHTVSGASESAGVVTLTVSTLGVDETPLVTLVGSVSDIAGNTVSSGSVTASDGIVGPDTIAVTTSSPSTTVAGSAVTVTVYATVGGVAVANGTTINITTNLGSLNATSATTAAGYAYFTLTPGVTSGTSTVTATSYSVSGSASVTINPSSFARLAVSAASSSIYANSSSTTITAQLQDQYGNNMSQAGTAVTFTSSKGTITALAATDSTGRATATLTSGATIESATVTASVGSTSATASVSFVAVPYNDKISLATNGWSFVSVPKYLAASVDTKAELFGNNNITSVLTYNTGTSAWSEVSGSTNIYPLTGYWVRTNGSVPDTALSYLASNASTPYTKSVSSGWNALGHTNTATMKAESALVSIDSVYSHILGWLASSQSYGSPGINGIASGTAYSNADYEVQPGNGYWVFATANGTLASLTN